MISRAVGPAQCRRLGYAEADGGGRRHPPEAAEAVRAWVEALPAGAEGRSRDWLPKFIADTGESSAAWGAQKFGEHLRALRGRLLSEARRVSNAVVWRRI